MVCNNDKKAVSSGPPSSISRIGSTSLPLVMMSSEGEREDGLVCAREVGGWLSDVAGGVVPAVGAGVGVEATGGGDPPG